jgi:outer membrane receptor protein involved in Fe transport
MQDARVLDFSIGARDYLDLGAQFSFSNAWQGLTLGVGVENVGNEEPPIYPSFQQANTEPSQYDVLGRRYYVNISYSFGTNP